MNSVEKYKKRRDERIKSRMDADSGRWVTTENDHKIHFNESGEPDKGNPHVIAAMKGGKTNGASGGEVPKKIRGMEVVGNSKDGDFAITYSKNDLGSKYRVMSRVKAEDGSSSWARPVAFKTIGEANDYMRKMEDAREKIKANPAHASDQVSKGPNEPEKADIKKALGEIREYVKSGDSSDKYTQAKVEDLRNKLGMDKDEFTKAWNWVQHEQRMKVQPDEEKKWHPEYNKSEKEYFGGGSKGNKEYSYGPGEEKNKKPQAVGETSYERFPMEFKMGGREYASPDDVKKIRETVSRFMKNAKEGDVYTTGGGVGSAGSKFKVVRSRGKLGLAWERDGYYLRPVQMSRQNVEKFISNGAKLVK